MNDEIKTLIEDFNIAVDNYSTTLNVLKLFGHEMCCAPGSINPKEGTVCWCGRRMTTSAKTEITPDLVIKLEKLFGIIAEVKNSLPKEQNYWTKSFNQLSQYDGNLKGWNEEDKEQVSHDLILLVPNRLRVVVEDYITKKVNDGDIDFKRNFAAVSYHREDKAKTFYYFCRFYGQISDSKKDEELRKIAQVPSDIILPTYNYFFCDEKPPLPYTMSNVWSYVSDYLDQDALIEKHDIHIVFEASQLIYDIKAANSPVIINMSQDEYKIEDDPRNPSYPKAEWIKEALDELIKLEYFEKNEDNGKYSIPLKKYRRVRDSLEVFKKKIAQAKFKLKSSEKTGHKQLSFFNND